MNASTCTALIVGLLMASGASGQSTIYRCGPDGREFSQKPCVGGQIVGTTPAPSPADARAARQAVERDKQLGRDMERERLRQEKAATPRKAASEPGPVAASGNLRIRSKRAKQADAAASGADFRAVVPHAAKPAKGASKP